MTEKPRSQVGVVRPLRDEQQQEASAIPRLKHRGRVTWQKLDPGPCQQS